MNRKNIRSNNKGFSLVELIIVIAIMGALVSIVAPQYIKYVNKSRRAADLQLAEQVLTAVNVAIIEGATVKDGMKITLNGSGVGVPDPTTTNLDEMLVKTLGKALSLVTTQVETHEITVKGDATDGYNATGDWTALE